MAKNVIRKPRNLLNQATFEGFMPPAKGVRLRVDAARKAFLSDTRKGPPIPVHIEVGPEEAQVILDLSDIESKDLSEHKVDRENEELLVVERMARDMASDNWVPNGDTVILNRRGGAIEGIKTLMAVIRANRVVRLSFACGVENEARFSTDDTVKTPGNRKAEMTYCEPRLPAAAPTLNYAGMNPDVCDAVRRAFSLRDSVSELLGYPVLPHLDVGTLGALTCLSGAVSVPLHLEILVRACLKEVAPHYAKAFMSAWAGMPAVPATSASKLGGRKLRKSLSDEVEFMTTVAVAIESFVDGVKDDPYQTRADSRRTQRQLLQVLFGYASRLPDRLVSCRMVKSSVEELMECVEARGRLPLSPSEMERIDPLVRDVRRNRGLVLTGQTTKYDENGLMLDGIDRALACIVAGYPMVTFASFNFEAGFDHVRPRGRKQGVGHRFYQDGYAYTWDMQSTLRNAYRMSENDRTMRPTNTTLRHVHRLHPQTQDIVMFVHQLEDLVKISALAPAHLALSRYSRDLADSFSSELFDIWKEEIPVTEERHRILAKLVDELESIRAMDTADNDHTICIIIQAMDAWCNERPLTSFDPLPEKGFRRLPMPPQTIKMQDEARVIRAAKKARFGDVA